MILAKDLQEGSLNLIFWLGIDNDDDNDDENSQIFYFN